MAAMGVLSPVKKNNTYKVQDNGKAPAGLKTNDLVVTGGGTYQITGVNADGSYKSKLVNDKQTTNNYQGQYTSAPTADTKSTSTPKPTSTSSQYKAKGTYNDAGLPESARIKIAQEKANYDTAIAAGNMKAAEEAHKNAEAIRAEYGYRGGDDGSEYIALPNDAAPSFSYSGYVGSNPKPKYKDQYADDISAKLDEILSREAFSYNVENDPMWQQYKEQYEREGARAMENTLAELAAGAGGMNSYAVTAAGQANNYYLQQLGDKIPELHQLAYNMYLNDIDAKVRDLGLLQQMSDSEYNRYQDTLAGWRDDRNFAYDMAMDEYAKWVDNRDFAYGVNRDMIADNQWQQSFDTQVDQFNQSLDFEKEQAAIQNTQWQQSFDTANSQWDKTFNYNAERDKIADSRYASETAYDRAIDMLSAGVMPSSSILAAANIDEAEASALYEAATGGVRRTSSSDGAGGNPGSPKKVIEVKTPKTVNGKTYEEYEEAAGHYATVASVCEQMYASEGKAAVLKMLVDAYEDGVLNLGDYSSLYNKYRDKK